MRVRMALGSSAMEGGGRAGATALGKEMGARCLVPFCPLGMELRGWQGFRGPGAAEWVGKDF